MSVVPALSSTISSLGPGSPPSTARTCSAAAAAVRPPRMVANGAVLRPTCSGVMIEVVTWPSWPSAMWVAPVTVISSRLPSPQTMIARCMPRRTSTSASTVVSSGANTPVS